MQQHRNIEVSGATIECTLHGSGTPVVLLASAGCSSGYFDDLAHVDLRNQQSIRSYEIASRLEDVAYGLDAWRRVA